MPISPQAFAIILAETDKLARRAYLTERDFQLREIEKIHSTEKYWINLLLYLELPHLPPPTIIDYSLLGRDMGGILRMTINTNHFAEKLLWLTGMTILELQSLYCYLTDKTPETINSPAFYTKTTWGEGTKTY